MLLRRVERKLRLLQRVVACFCDLHDPERIEYGLQEMLAQHIYGLALGNEDLIMSNCGTTRGWPC